MTSFTQRVFAESSFGEDVELPKAGTPIESTWAYDSAARELHELADKGLVRIVRQRTIQVRDEEVIADVVFRRLR